MQIQKLTNTYFFPLHTGTVCDCNGMDLKQVPSFQDPSQIVSIDLSNNMLSNISRLHLSDFTALRFIDILENPIQEIDSKAFLNSPQMIELRLSANLLKYNSLRGIYKNCFKLCLSLTNHSKISTKEKIPLPTL